MFKKYMHLEKYGNTEVEGIEIGECYIFPKLDGTNASVWYDGKDVKAGSRNRELTLDKDNAGFFHWVENGVNNGDIFCCLEDNPTYRLYGEWLQPHTLKTYRDNAWAEFYIFDVYDDATGQYLHYDDYKKLADGYQLTTIPPLAILKNATYDNLLHEVENNTYLIADGKGVGEGIVIKNYSYQNKYGRVCWAKMVTNQFKDNHRKDDPQRKLMKEMVEQRIVDNYLDKVLVDKTYAKIVSDMQGWSSKYIPRLISTVYHDFVTEEIWASIKKFKNPTINFKTLQTIATLKIKELLPEVF